MTDTFEHLQEEQFASLALDAGQLPDGQPDEAAQRHLALCPQCSAELAAHRRVLDALGTLPAASPAPELLARVRGEIVAKLEAERAPKGATSHFGVVTAGVVAVVGAIAFATLGDFELLGELDGLVVARWVLAMGVFGSACAIALLAPRSGRTAALSLAAAVGGSLLLGALDLLAASPAMGEHLGCEMIMMLSALAPMTAALFSLRSASGGTGARVLQAAAGGAAGALAGQAALFTTCSSPEGMVHVLVFHLLTFAGIAGASALLGRLTIALRPA